MSSVLAHALSASWVAVTFAQVAPSETPYLLVAAASATALDLDHTIFVIRDRAIYRRTGYQGHLHRARSAFHELLGLMLAGIISGLVFFADPKLARVIFIAFAIHVVQDWMLGKAYPLAPTDSTETQFFALTFRQKVFVDLVGVTVFGILWIIYLAGGG